MSMSMLQSGEPVYHPRCGFGTVLGIGRQDVRNLTDERVAGEQEDYYEIGLLGSGTLFVPVGRAKDVGLRRLINSLAAIESCLASSPGALPDDSRQRLAALQASERAEQPDALLKAVRDLAASARGRSLSPTEQKWLDQACRRLSTEAALVDHVTEAEARSAIWRAVERLSNEAVGSGE